jgi:cytochrome P450
VHIHSFAEDNLKYVVLDLLSSGRETTATTIQWAVLFLVNHPEVQENIRIERTENTSEDCSPQLSEKSHFPYCEAVMTESQRLGNILPMSLRNTASDDVKVEGYRIPKGALVIPNLDSIMHDETIFPDSYKFDPTRFLNEEGNFHGLENILPFSLGKFV